MKLIEIQAHTGFEYINPEQISHISAMRGYMLITMVNQAMLPVSLEEWQRIKPMLVAEDKPAADNELPF